MSFFDGTRRGGLDRGASPRPPRRPERSADPGYRPDIEYLRAVAVLAVIGFHWNVRPFRGGFVGVDVFFVISGYLITRMILSEMSSGRFSCVDFYERRARRLLPALYTVMAAVALLSWFYLVPPDLQELGESILAVISFTSNILFWRQAGYFDRPALDKPLLHTWSLAVEEQFYLVFPLLIFVLAVGFRGRHRVSAMLAGLGLMAMASFVLSLWGVANAPDATFYLAPFRAWEFLLGSLLFIAGAPGPRTAAIRRAAYALGLAAILAAVVTYRPRTPFPGFAALLPCLGASLCLWAPIGAAQNPERSLARVGAFFGRISYSLYLWHWPILVYGKLLLGSGQDLSPGCKWLMFGVAIGLSYLSFRFIEQPVRNRVLLPRRTCFATAALSASAVLVAFAAGGFASGGYPTRLEPAAARIADYVSYPYQALYREGTCFLTPEQSIAAFDTAKCLDRPQGAATVLLWGDSMAAHYAQALSDHLAPLGYHLIQANAASCPPFLDPGRDSKANCKSLNDRVRSSVMEERPKLVILSAHWLNYAIDAGYEPFSKKLQETISLLQSLGIKVVLFGPSIQYTEALPHLMARSALRGYRKIDPNAYLQPAVFVLDHAMQNDFGRASLTYVSIVDLICPDHACPTLVKAAVPLQWDEHHLTAEGSQFIVLEILPQLTGALPKP